MRSILLSNITLSMVLSIAAPNVATAAVFNATYFNDAFVDQTGSPESSSSTTAATSGLSASGAHGQASTSNNYAVPSVSAQASSDAGWSSGADSRLTYAIEFTGGFGFQSVHVKTQGSADFTGTSGTVETILAIDPVGLDPNSPFTFLPGGGLPEVIFERLEAINTTAAFHQSFSIDGTYQFWANEIYQVSLSVGLGTEDAGSASSFIDPFFVAPPGFTLLISSDIGNSLPPAATPLPAGLPLFATGLAGLGWFARRRRMQAAA